MPKGASGKQAEFLMLYHQSKSRILPKIRNFDTQVIFHAFGHSLSTRLTALDLIEPCVALKRIVFFFFFYYGIASFIEAQKSAEESVCETEG